MFGNKYLSSTYFQRPGKYWLQSLFDSHKETAGLLKLSGLLQISADVNPVSSISASEQESIKSRLKEKIKEQEKRYQELLPKIVTLQNETEQVKEQLKELEKSKKDDPEKDTKKEKFHEKLADIRDEIFQ